MRSPATERRRRARKFWASSILLLALFVTITPVFLIISADEQQSAASAEWVAVLFKLDQLGSGILELENAASSASWQSNYAAYRAQSQALIPLSARIPELREILLHVDSTMSRMAEIQLRLIQTPAPPDRLIAEFRSEDRAALTEVLNAQRLVRVQLSLTAKGIAEKAQYLKILIAAACLLAFGLVFVFRKFRIDNATQRRLEQDLRNTHDEVIAALTAARDSSETLNHFLINASHVMDARVKSMIEATAALLKTNLSDPQRTSVETILQSAESFDRYINDMVDFSDIETGNLELEVEEFAPANVIEEAGNLFRSVAERKGLKFHCMDGEGLPPSVRGDRGRLRQVLNHLIHNAIRFTEQGEISVRARLMNETAGRSKLRFEVRDTGIGLTERVRGRLFQPFCRPEDSSVPDAGTGGLGLAISKRLAELMGGGIEVFSKAGNGTTFWLTAVFETARKEDTNSDDRVTPTTATA
ncbi:MAG: ATP-binding protein, partial [Bryobacteraceae bacterium]